MKLNELRKETGLKQSELALLSGVNLRSLQDYEQGHKSLLSAKGETLLLLSKVLGCSIEDVLSSYTVNIEDSNLAKKLMANRLIAYKNALDKRKNAKVHFPVVEPSDYVDMSCIYPTKQKMVAHVLDNFHADKRVKQLRLFGSSITMACHQNSDIDFAVEVTEPSNEIMNEVSEKIQTACDWTADIIWMNHLNHADRIYRDIMNGLVLL